MRVLVTGGTGLIGRPAVAALVQNGCEVHLLSRGCLDSIEGAYCHKGNVLDVADVDRLLDAVRPTHLLHLAWVTEHGAFWTSPQNTLWLSASKHLIEAFVRHGGLRAVVSGSCAEYDWTDLGDGICHEDRTPLKPHTLYGQCKVDLFTWLMAQPLCAAWGRVFLPFGIGEDKRRLVPSVALALQAGLEAKCSSGKQVRDFMAAEDVGRAFAALLVSGVEGAVNVASGEPHTIAEVAETLGRISGHPERVRLGALPDRADDPPVLLADVTRLINEVGFSPNQGFRQGLEAVYHRLAEEGRA